MVPQIAQIMANHMLRRGLIRSLKSSAQPKMMSTISTNFDELIVQLERAEDIIKIRSLMHTALGYESSNIHAAAYESAHLSTHRLKDWEESLRLIKEMEKRKLLPSARAFSLTAQACAGHNQWEEAANVVRKAWANQVNVDPKCITSVLLACQESCRDPIGGNKRVAICLEFLDNTPPELRSKQMIRSAFSCVCESGSVSEGYELLRKLEFDHDKSRSSPVLISAYTSLMNHMVEHNEAEKTLELFDEARDYGYHFNEDGYDIAMKAAMLSDRPALAVDLFLQLEEDGVAPKVSIARRVLDAMVLIDDPTHIKMLLPYLLDYARPDLTITSLATLCKIYISNGRNDEALDLLVKYILSVLPQSRYALEGGGEEDEFIGWCDEEWARDRGPLIIDHAFSVLMQLKDMENALALVKSMGKEMDGFVPAELIMLCRDLNLKAKDYVMTIDTCLEAGLDPAPNAYSNAIAQCKKEDDYSSIVKLFETMNPEHSMSVIAFNTVLDAYGRLGKYESSLELLYEADKRGVVPNVRTFNSALSACTKAGRWSEARDLLKIMRSSDMRPSEISYSSTLQACRKAGRFDPAMEVLGYMKEDGVEPNVIHYNILLATAGFQGYSHKAQDIMTEMIASGVEPNSISYNTALNTFGSGRDFYKVMQLFCVVMPGQGAIVEQSTLQALLHALQFASYLNAVHLLSLWLNSVGLELNFKTETSPLLGTPPMWPKMIDIVSETVERGRLTPSLESFLVGVKSCEQFEWKREKGGSEKGEFEGGRSARLLVDAMSKLRLSPNKAILETCLKALLEQLQHDKAYGKNRSKRMELLEMTFRTIEEVESLRGYRASDLGKLLHHAVLHGVDELEQVTRHVKRKATQVRFRK